MASTITVAPASPDPRPRSLSPSSPHHPNPPATPHSHSHSHSHSRSRSLPRRPVGTTTDPSSHQSIAASTPRQWTSTTAGDYVALEDTEVDGTRARYGYRVRVQGRVAHVRNVNGSNNGGEYIRGDGVGVWRSGGGRDEGRDKEQEDEDVRKGDRKLRGYGIGGAGNIRRPTDVIHASTPPGPGSLTSGSATLNKLSAAILSGRTSGEHHERKQGSIRTAGSTCTEEDDDDNASGRGSRGWRRTLAAALGKKSSRKG